MSEELLVFLSYAGVALVFYWLGKLAVVRKLYQLRDLLEEEEHVQKDKARHIYKLKIEEVDSMLYLYNRDNDSFIGQAQTLIDLVTLAKKRNNIELATVIKGDKIFMFVNGEVIEYTGIRQYET